MIARMKHLDLICLASEGDATLVALRDLGAVHLDLASASGECVSEARGDVASAETAVLLVRKARGKAKVEELEIRARSVEETLAISSDRETLAAEKERLEREIKSYESYGDFDPELARRLLDRGVDIADRLPPCLPEMRLSRMREKLERVENRIRIDDAKLAATDDAAIVRKFPDLADRVAFAAARELLENRGAVGVVSGWIPESCVAALHTSVAKMGWGVLIRDPAEGETPPTLIEPPRLFRPVKVLFAGLGIAPAYTESDVSVPFMCYFSLFFAMLVGDGGYGAIFLAITLAMRRRLPYGWFPLLAVFSASAIVWGILSNTWFGAALPWCADWPTVRWLGDVTYKNIMFLCFTIGVSHLMLARLWNAVCRFPDSTALAELGWAGVLLFMYFVTNSLVGIFESLPDFMIWVFGASLLLVFLFSVKPKDLKTNGISLGMLPLNIMSALGDIISYVRLFAVGLASVKVAENFNSMAVGLLSPESSIWTNALLSVGTVLILVAGHTLNLAMAALSILVHAVRLNTLEFSNHKGVSWAGHAFSPFKNH